MYQLNYDPNALVNSVICTLHLKNDFHLSKVLGISPSTIARIRYFQLPVSASILVRLHQETGLSVKELRAMMGDERKFFERIDLTTCTKILSPAYKKLDAKYAGMENFVGSTRLN